MQSRGGPNTYEVGNWFDFNFFSIYGLIIVLFIYSLITNLFIPVQKKLTSWLQILRTQQSDSGFYHCVARNSEGEDQAFGKLTIVEKESAGGQEDANEINEIQKK